MNNVKKIVILLLTLSVMTGFAIAASHEGKSDATGSDLAGGRGRSPTRAKVIRLR